jgi:NTP pyrophosphatase (non-canonical NTP hydrolase)
MNKDIIERSIKEYGRITQSVICMEECSELIQAVSKQIRGIGSKENLVEEMADVTICLEMLKDIYDIDDTEIGQQIQYKQDRMEQRMDREEICEMCIEYMPDTQCEYETECKMMETLRKIKDLKEQNMVLQEENNRIKAEITGRQS